MEIQCSNCGMEIPFEGNVCPHCGTNKTACKQRVVRLKRATSGGALIGVSVGLAIFIASDYSWGGVLAVMFGAVIGTLVGRAIGGLKRRN